MRPFYRFALIIGATLVAVMPVVAQTDAADRIIAEKRAAEARDRAEAASVGLSLVTADVPEIEDETPCINVNEIRVEGITLLDADTVSDVLAPYAKRCIGAAGIDALLQSLSGQYLEKGYITSRAFIPEQDLSSGVLTLVVVEGFIEAIALRRILRGEVDPEAKPRRVTLAFPIEAGEVLELRAIEQGVDNLNSLRSVSAGLDIQPGQDVGGSILAINVEEDDRYRGTFGLRYSHHGNASFILSLAADNVFQANDAWSLAVSGGEEDNALALSFGMPVRNTRVSASVTYSEALSALTPTTEIFEWNQSWRVEAERLLSRDQTVKSYANLSLRATRNARSINGTSLDDVVTEALRFGWRQEVVPEAGGFRSAGVGMTIGHAPALDEKPFAIDANWSAFRAMENGLTVYSTITAQISGRVLPSSLQFSVGGAGQVRGFDGASVSGSGGAIMSHEIGFDASYGRWIDATGRTESWLADLSPYAFLDAGLVTRPGHETDKLASLGFGIRLTRDRFTANVSLAQPILERGSAQSDGVALRLDVTPVLF